MSRGVHLGFAAEDQVAFHECNGNIIMKEKAQNTLHIYKLHVAKNTYQEIWSEDFLHGVNTACVKAFYCDQNDGLKFLLQDRRTLTTQVLSSEGRKLLDSWHYEGILLTCDSYEKMYAVKKAEGKYEIVIVDHKYRNEKRLQPVNAKPTWSHPYLSVCKMKKRIVVASIDRTLDIYFRCK